MMGALAKALPRLRNSDLDGWFIYVALCPAEGDVVLAKVGISTVPYDRLYTINCNSPYPVEMAFFSPVWTKKRALAIERGILAAFEDRKTRGEWLRLDASTETKTAFAAKCKELIRKSTGAPPDWTKATGEQIRIAGNVRLADGFARRPG